MLFIVWRFARAQAWPKPRRKWQRQGSASLPFKHVGSIQEHYIADAVYSVKESMRVSLTSAGLYKKKNLRSRGGITAEDRSGIKRPSASNALVGNNPGCGCPAELPPRCFSSQICRRLTVGYAPQHHRAFQGCCWERIAQLGDDVRKLIGLEMDSPWIASCRDDLLQHSQNSLSLRGFLGLGNSVGWRERHAPPSIRRRDRKFDAGTKTLQRPPWFSRCRKLWMVSLPSVSTVTWRASVSASLRSLNTHPFPPGRLSCTALALPDGCLFPSTTICVLLGSSALIRAVSARWGVGQPSTTSRCWPRCVIGAAPPRLALKFSAIRPT